MPSGTAKSALPKTVPESRITPPLPLSTTNPRPLLFAAIPVGRSSRPMPEPGLSKTLTQRPAAQTAPSPSHTAPHAPQFLTSVLRLTHRPLQSVPPHGVPPLPASSPALWPLRLRFLPFL